MTQASNKVNAEDAVKAGSDAVAKGYDQFVNMTREQFEKFVPNATKGFDELATFGKGNVDAAVKAGTIAAKGWEIIGKEVADYNKRALEQGMANAKALMGVKTVQEAVELQTGFARISFDEFVAEGTKLSEMGLKVAREASEPINARVNAAVETFTKATV